MKIFRYHIALLTIVLMAMAVNVQAQDDERALGAAADTIIRTETRDYIVNRIVEKVYQEHPTASLATRLAKAYYNYNENSETKERMFHKNDTVHAFLYIRRAIELDPKYADAYILASDIFDYDRNDEAAMQWLDEGLKHNPTEPSLYMAQAKLMAIKNEQAAVAKYEEIRKIDPKFPVDLELGRMYYKLFDRGGTTDERYAACEKVVAYYGKANKDEMTAGDIGAYALAINFVFSSNPALKDTWYEVTTFGVQKYPEDIGIRMFLFYACWAAEKWDEAIAAAQNYFSMQDATKIEPIQRIRYGMCLRNAKRYDEAIAQYEMVLEMDGASDNNKRQAENNLATAVSAQSDEARKAGDYDKAIAIIKPYVEKYNAKGKQNDLLISSYGRIYMVQSVDLEGAAKEEMLMKADKIFADAIPNTKDNDDMFAYQRYVIHSQLDPTKEKGLAIPFINEVIRIIQSKKEMSRGQTARLVSVYLYMCVYELQKRNKKAVAEYAEKIMDLDPTNEDAPKFAAWAASK